MSESEARVGSSEVPVGVELVAVGLDQYNSMFTFGRIGSNPSLPDPDDDCGTDCSAVGGSEQAVDVRDRFHRRLTPGNVLVGLTFQPGLDNSLR